MTYRYRGYHRPMTTGQKAAVAVAAAVVLGAGGSAGASTKHHGRGSRPGTASLPSANVITGQQMAAAAGWTHGQWHCLDWLWTRESGWRNKARNAKSGAYGIAQALGHGPTNQYPAGPANPPRSSARAQIRWGLGYIRATYGSPCQAWAHETADGWY